MHLLEMSYKISKKKKLTCTFVDLDLILPEHITAIYVNQQMYMLLTLSQCHS
jgi:hypothetical protein